MRQFYAPTEDLIKSAHTVFTSDIAAGEMTIPVENTAQFTASKYLCLSKEGIERAELIRITDIDATAKTLTIESPGTKFAHYKDEPAVQFDYNQRRLYKRASEEHSWAHVSVESPKDIAVDCPLGTLFENASGESTDRYAITYYNSFTEVGTFPDDAKEIVGTTTTNLVSLQQIRVAAGFEDNFHLSDSKIDEIRQDAQGEVWAALRKKYTFPITKKSSFLRRIVIDLSVGMLYLDEYGTEVQNVALDGEKKCESARKRLDKLATGKYTLYDEVEEENQGTAEVGTPSFYPDDTTEDEDDERIFEIGMEF